MLVPFLVRKVSPPLRGGGEVAPNEARLYHIVQYYETLKSELEHMQQQQQDEQSIPRGHRIMSQMLLLQDLEETIEQLQAAT